MIFLITGGAGFIGHHTVQALLAENHKVLVIDNESAVSNETFHWDDRASNYKLDITDYESIRPLFNDVDAVIHLAAQSRIQPSIIDVDTTMRTNVFGTANVLRCAKEAGVKRFVFASSSSVYGNNATPNTEDQIEDCLNPYASSKLFGEKMCEMYSNYYGLETISLRYFNVYGPNQPSKGEFATVIAKFEKGISDGEPLTIVGKGTQRRDFTHVDDIVRANIKASTIFLNERYFGQTYNVGTGKNYSINEIAKMFNSKTKKIPSRPGEATETLADTMKIGRSLGWFPAKTIDTYVYQFVKSIKS